MTLIDKATNAYLCDVALARVLHDLDAPLLPGRAQLERLRTARILAEWDESEAKEIVETGYRPRGLGARQLPYWDKNHGLTWRMLHRRLVVQAGEDVGAFDTLRRELSGDGIHTTTLARLDSVASALKVPTSYLLADDGLLTFSAEIELAAIVAPAALLDVVLASRLLDLVRFRLIRDPASGRAFLRDVGLFVRDVVARSPSPRDLHPSHSIGAGSWMLRARLAWGIGVDLVLPPLTAGQKKTIWMAVSKIRWNLAERRWIEESGYEPSEAERRRLPFWDRGCGLTIGMLFLRIADALPDTYFDLSVARLERQLTEIGRRSVPLAVVEAVCEQSGLTLAHLFGQHWKRPAWLHDFRHAICLLGEVAPAELRELLEDLKPLRTRWHHTLLDALILDDPEIAAKALRDLAAMLRTVWDIYEPTGAKDMSSREVDSDRSPIATGPAARRGSSRPGTASVRPAAAPQLLASALDERAD